MNSRQKKLLEKLNKTGRLSIEKEAMVFHVSSMTIRRDLKLLEGSGLAVSVRGGAISRSGGGGFLVPKQSTPAQKRIAARAAKLLESGSTVMLSIGTTTLEIARQLAVSDMQLTVVTNSLPVAAALFQTRARVLLTGGVLRAESLDLVGPIPERNLSEFHIDLLISGCDGAISDEGFFTSDMNMAAVEKQSAAVSERIVVVTESGKFRGKSFVRFASVDDVAMVITDRGLRDADRKKLKRHRIEVLTV